MAAQTLGSKAGPVSIMYELDSKLPQPPVAQASDTAYVHDSQQQPHHSPIASIPESPTRSSHSPNPSVGYPPSQETSPAGRHQSLAALSATSPIDQYRASYQTQPDSAPANSPGSEASYGNNQAAPRYSAPVTGYYAPGVQYNPDQSYGVAGAPYPQAQSPPPVKTEYSSSGAPPPSAPSEPPAGAVAPVASGKGVCGMKTTVFLLLCVILFLIIAGAVLGGVFGSGVLKKKDDPVVLPISTSIVTSTSEAINPSSTTTTITTTSSSTPIPSTTFQPYPIPTGTWTITGGLSRATGSCITDPSKTDYKEVWYCPENKTATIVIKDLSSTDYVYYLDMDSPARVRGIRGDPPTGTEVKDGKSPFWTFTLDYDQHNASFASGCDVNVQMVFLLGKSKAIAGFFEQAYSRDVCKQPWGGDSLPGLRCSCGYIQNW